jgi:hypothetical protein
MNVWKSITSVYANRLERIQQKFTIRDFYRFFSMSITVTFVPEKAQN